MEMTELEKVIRGLRDIDMFIAGRLEHEKAKNFLRTIDETIILLKEQEDLGTELTNAVELIHKKNERIEKLLKEQEETELCDRCGRRRLKSNRSIGKQEKVVS